MFFFLSYFFLILINTQQPEYGVNLLLNPSFETGDLSDWGNVGSTGVYSFINDGGSQVLVMENVDEGRIGITQTITFDPPTEDILYFKFRGKAELLEEGFLATLDIYIEFDDETHRYYMTDLKLLQEDVGLGWVERESFYVPQQNVTKLRVMALQYYAKSLVHWDDIETMVFKKELFRFNTGSIQLEYTNLGLLGSMKAVETGTEILRDTNPTASIYLTDSTILESRTMQRSGSTDYYDLTFNDEAGLFGLRLEIKTVFPDDCEIGGVTFEVISVTNPENLEISFVEFFKVAVSYNKESTSWYEDHSQNDVIFHTIPLSDKTTCYSSSTSYCRVDWYSGVESAKGSIVAGKVSSFYEIAEKFVRFHPHLPYLQVGPQKTWVRAKPIRESYLFASISETNHEDMLKWTDIGKFPVFLMIFPTYGPSYTIPKSFGHNTTRFYEVMDKFIDRGIGLGWHGMMCRIHPGDPLYSAQRILKFEMTTLTSPLDNITDAYTLDVDVTETVEYKHYSQFIWFGDGKHFFIINDEIMKCTVTEMELTECKRGTESTKPGNHAAGSTVYYAAQDSGGFNFDPSNEEIMNQSLEGWEELSKRLKLKYVYEDGSVFLKPPVEPIKSDTQFGLTYTHRTCSFPYLRRMPDLEYMQHGEGGSTYDWMYSSRVASWDGVVYKNKEFTKNFKLMVVRSNNRFKQTIHEFGWWKIHGSRYDKEGKWDYDSTTYNDVHYVMSKVLVTDRSVGLQLSSYYQNHARIDDLFRVVGKYHELIALDVASPAVDQEAKDHFSEPDVELELQDNFDLMETRSVRQYIPRSGFEFTVNNPFKKAQKLEMMINPRFDYFDYGHEDHVLISEFPDRSAFGFMWPSAWTGEVECTFDEGSSTFTVVNHDMKKIHYVSIPIVTEDLDLSFARGLGVSLTVYPGSHENALINFHIHHSSQHGYRDFLVFTDFEGRKDLLLGDPTTKIKDYLNETMYTTSGYSRTQRSWNFDWSKLRVTMNVYLLPDTQTSFQLHSMKGLRERSTVLRAPKLTMEGGRKIEFPDVVLDVNETEGYWLEYDPKKKTYLILTPNQEVVASGKVKVDTMRVKPGENRLKVEFDTSAKYSQRAFVQLVFRGDTYRPLFNRVETWKVAVLTSFIGAALLVILLVFVVVIVVVSLLVKREGDGGGDYKNEEFDTKQ